MTGTTLERQLQAARPAADASEARLEALVASRLFGPERAAPPKIGRFTLLERIGRGGMGEVHAAYDPLLDRKVALKLLRGDAGHPPRHLLDEARAAARLAHPNVVAILEVGELADAGIYVVMEFIAGLTLRAWLRRGPPPAQMLAVFDQAGRGLAAAHDAGLVHRDFKPDNVLVCGDDEPRARVVDFGLAHPLAAPTPSEPHAGTPAYMAPEQLRGRAVDPRADQFSFCVALHEALAGRHPFAADEPGTTPAILLARILAGELQPGPRPIPGWLRHVLHRGLAAEPARRFPSMHHLLRELRATPARRRRRALLTAGLALVLASSALTLLGRDNLSTDPCLATAAQRDAIWDPTTRRRAAANLLASGLGNAAELWLRLAPRVDDAVDAWQLASQQTCRARHAGPTSDDALRLRELCLLRHGAELRGLTDLLRETEPTTLLATLVALDRRTPLAACDDAESLRRELASVGPGDPLVPREALLHQLLALTPRVQAAAAPHTLLAELARWTSLTATRGDPGLHARALQLRARVEETLGRHDDAATTLTAALHDALAARHDRLHAELAVRLVWVHGVLRRDPVQAERWAAHAHAAVRALGDDPVLGPRLLDHRGAVASRNHDHAAAERLHRAAIARRGPHDTSVDQAASLANLGLALLADGQLPAAGPTIAAALDRHRALFGPHHPDVAAILSNFGQAHTAAGQPERGLEILRHALALKERSLGRDHLALFTTLNNLGSATSELGRSAEARAHYLRALSIGERHLGPDSPRIEPVVHNLAFEAWQLGAHAEVIRHSTHALTLQRRLYGEHHPILAPTLELLARGQLAAGQPAEAAITAEQALAQTHKGPLAPALRGAVLLSVAWIRHHTGAPAAQVQPLLDEAEQLLRPAPGPSREQQQELLALRQGPRR